MLFLTLTNLSPQPKLPVSDDLMLPAVSAATLQFPFLPGLHVQPVYNVCHAQPASKRQHSVRCQ